MTRIGRLALVVAAAALAALPAGAGAAGRHGNRCGKGHTKHTRALGKACVKHHSSAHGRSEAAPPAPITVPAAVVKACKDELAADPVAFQAKYANAAGREALGRCIRINAAAGDSGDTAPTPPSDNHDGDGSVANAAQACAAEKAADANAFQAKYADANGREAFGHCVREHVPAAPAGPPAGSDQGDQPSQDGSGDTPDQTDGSDTPDQTGGGDTGGGGDAAIPGLDSLFF